MFSAGKGPARAQVPPAVPVVPGGERVPGKCSACGGIELARGREVVGGVELVLCLDAEACTRAYRGGVSPETFAAGLRGEILAVAP